MGYSDPEQEKLQKKKYYKKNRRRIIKRAKAWNKAHPERVREIKERFRENNPEYYKAYKRKEA